MSFQGMIRTGDMRNAKAEEYTDANDAARHIQVSESGGGFTGPSEAHMDLRRSRGAGAHALQVAPLALCV